MKKRHEYPYLLLSIAIHLLVICLAYLWFLKFEMKSKKENQCSMTVAPVVFETYKEYKISPFTITSLEERRKNIGRYSIRSISMPSLGPPAMGIPTATGVSITSHIDTKSSKSFLTQESSDNGLDATSLAPQGLKDMAGAWVGSGGGNGRLGKISKKVISSVPVVPSRKIAKTHLYNIEEEQDQSEPLSFGKTVDIEGEITKDFRELEKGQNIHLKRKPLLDVVFLYARTLRLSADHENSNIPQNVKEYIIQLASSYKKETNSAYGLVKFIDDAGATLHLYNLTTDIEQLKLWLEPDSRGVFLPNYGNSALDMIVAALEHISFREASRRLFLLMTRENISDMKEPLFKWTGEGRHRTGHYVSFYTFEEVLSMLKKAHVSVSVISKNEPHARLLAKETGGKWTLWQTVLQ